MIVGMAVKVNVRYFAAAADAAGRDEESLDFSAGKTIEDLRTEISDRHGGETARVLGLCSFLLDGQVVEPGTALPSTESVRVDVLPPFAGG